MGTYISMKNYCLNRKAISPQVWGPVMWNFLHAISRCATCMYRFDVMFRMIARSIPCDACRAHALKYLRSHPPPRVCTDPAAFEHTVTFHNRLNKMHKRALVSIEDARKLHPARSIGVRARALAVALEDARPIISANAACDGMHCSIAPPDSRTRTRCIDATIRVLQRVVA